MDDESKAKIQSLLSKEIPQENIDIFLGLVDEFNSVPYKGSVEHGWKKAFIPLFSYKAENGFAHLEAQDQAHMINCRSAAFILLKNGIHFKETGSMPTVCKDIENRFSFVEPDSVNYDLLFADIESNDIDSSETLAKKVKEYWEAVGIEFSESAIQLVMVYATYEDAVQNIHTGVMISSEDCIWLIEKVDPIHPYQLACFKNQNQLIDYLKKRASNMEYVVIFSGDTCLWEK